MNKRNETRQRVMKLSQEVAQTHQDAQAFAWQVTQQQRRKELDAILHRDRNQGRGLGIGCLVAAAIAAGIIILLLASCIPATPGRWLTPSPRATTTRQTATPQPTSTPSTQPTPSQAPTQTRTPTPTPPPSGSCIVTTGGIAPGTVNVRSGPGMQYQVVDVAKAGETLTIYGQPQDGWQLVTTPRHIAGFFYTRQWCK